MVLHATDPMFDKVRGALPSNHFYTGPLFWEIYTTGTMCLMQMPNMLIHLMLIFYHKYSKGGIPTLLALFLTDIISNKLSFKIPN